MRIGKRLKELRLEKNLTQKKVELLTGIKRSSIAQYELDEQLPPIDKLVQFAFLYNVSVDYICGIDNRNIRNVTKEKTEIS